MSTAQISDFKAIDFSKADARALRLKGENLNNLPDLSKRLTDGLYTEAERFRAIYKWVCENVSNDYNLYFKNKARRENYKGDSLKLEQWNTKFRKILFKKLLRDKRTICTGYAYLVKELASLADISCVVVQGYGRVSSTEIDNLSLPNHSWNAVKLNGKWYLCDPTWAAGIPDPETNAFSFQYNDGFFLAEPRLFAFNHYPIDSKWWLLTDGIPDFDTFLRSPIIYGNAYRNLEMLNGPLKMHHSIKRNETIAIELQLNKALEDRKIGFVIDSGSSQWEAKPYAITYDNKSLEVEHQFNSRGFYDVHLYLDKDLIATYTVEVN
ncbi:hypothetical protein J4050_02925 [Winogradskyella sp. DF17]|uniref:Transglutaminase-like domain-containing protein n=1 Tax=Winogradskyella pelagia TaxID=2819984 RepID=A0ABS3SYV8_9FLAO|nr:transglutaminase domain-containing protein [Winogradskyella sp. DF17]MBO3115681.1 hypothetical protein [Winogradskyella sp. DF17]